MENVEKLPKSEDPKNTEKLIKSATSIKELIAIIDGNNITITTKDANDDDYTYSSTALIEIIKNSVKDKRALDHATRKYGLRGKIFALISAEEAERENIEKTIIPNKR